MGRGGGAAGASVARARRFLALVLWFAEQNRALMKDRIPRGLRANESEMRLFLSAKQESKTALKIFLFLADFTKNF